MAIEIRELIIKTQINATEQAKNGINEKELRQLKLKLSEEIKMMFKGHFKNNKYNR